MVRVARQRHRSRAAVDAEQRSIAVLAQRVGHATADVTIVGRGHGVDQLAGTAVFVDRRRLGSGCDHRVSFIQIVDVDCEVLERHRTVRRFCLHENRVAGLRLMIQVAQHADHTRGRVHLEEAVSVRIAEGVGHQRVGHRGATVAIHGKRGHTHCGAGRGVLVDTVGGAVRIRQEVDRELPDAFHVDCECLDGGGPVCRGGLHIDGAGTASGHLAVDGASHGDHTGASVDREFTGRVRIARLIGDQAVGDGVGGAIVVGGRGRHADRGTDSGVLHHGVGGIVGVGRVVEGHIELVQIVHIDGERLDGGGAIGGGRLDIDRAGGACLVINIACHGNHACGRVHLELASRVGVALVVGDHAVRDGGAPVGVGTEHRHAHRGVHR